MTTNYIRTPKEAKKVVVAQRLFGPKALQSRPVLSNSPTCLFSTLNQRTFRAVFATRAGRLKVFSANGTAPRGIWSWIQLPLQFLIIGQNSITKPFAQNRICDPLCTNIAERPVQYQTASLVIITAPLLDQPPCFPKLFLIHSRNLTHG